MKRKTNEYGFVNSSEDYEVNYAKSKGTRSGYRGRKYEGGGESDGPEIHILNKGEKFDRSRYKAVFGDYDNDGLPNLDDPNPTKKGDKNSVEERRITDSIAELLNIKNNLDNTMYSAVDDITKISPKNAVIYARTKTPYSIIQKLIGKRLLTPKDPKKGLTDLIGMTIAVNNFADLSKLRKLIENGKKFNVYEVEDFYKNPLDGYMAVHYILLFKDANGTFPVELQLKTKRMKSVNELSHKAYAQHNLDRDELLRVTSIVEKADKGNVTAIKQYDKLISDKDKLEDSFFKDKAKKYSGGGEVEKEEWSDAMEYAGGGDVDTKDFTNLPIGTVLHAYNDFRDAELHGKIVDKAPDGYVIKTWKYDRFPIKYNEIDRVVSFPPKLEPEMQPRKKFLGLFDKGGNVFVDKTDGTTYMVGKNAKGQWTVFSEGERWTKRDEFESGLASEQDAVMLAKVMAGVIDEFDPETNVSIYDDEDEYNQDFMGLDTMRYGGDVVRHFNTPKRFVLGGPVDDSMTAVQRYFANLNYDLLPTAFATFVKEEILNDPELPYLSEKEPIFITIKEKVDALQNREEVAVEVGELDSNVETQEAIDLLMELSEDQEGAEKQETLEAIELLKELLV